jgi:hypothetical protein
MLYTVCVSGKVKKKIKLHWEGDIKRGWYMGKYDVSGSITYPIYGETHSFVLQFACHFAHF